MTRRVRALFIASLVAFASIAGQFASPAWSAYQESSPAGGDPDVPQGDEGGDADEVLIRTSTRPDRVGEFESSAAVEALTWWHRALRWLGFSS